MGLVATKYDTSNDVPALTMTEKTEEILHQTLTRTTFVSDTAGLLLLSAQAPFLMQQIAVISSTAPDPSLISSNLPKEKFLNLKNPGSFKSCLCQVAGDTGRAYRQADYSMGTIKAVLQDLPNYFISALEILNQPHEDAKSQRSLKTLCSKIEDASKKCKEKALDAQLEFLSVMETIKELSIATVVTETENERKIAENKKREEILIIEQMAKVEANDTLKTETNKANERRDLAEKDFREKLQNDKTLTNVSAFTAAKIGGEIVNVLANTLTSGAMPLSSLKNVDWNGVLNMAKNGVEGYDICSEILKKMQTNSNYAKHVSLMRKLQTIVNSFEYTMDEQTILNHIAVLKDYETKEFDTSEGATLIGKVIELRHFLEANGQNLKNKNDRLRTASDQLIQERANAEKIRNERNKNAEELRQIIHELRQIDLTSTNLTGYIQHLNSAFGYLSKIETNWSYLVAFFDEIEIAVCNNLTTNALHFTEQVRDDSLQSHKIRSALTATTYCFQISQCAEIYTATSRKFIMPVISNITEQFGLTMIEATQKQKEIQKKLANVEEGVQQLIDEKMAEFEENIDSKIKTFATDLSNAIEYNSAFNSIE
uniref:Uncharacterized protein n=1 Tax=Panagrolaimus sp. ES5 TaxID=591445 RepID=A0AC34FPI1_9BILA